MSRIYPSDWAHGVEHIVHISFSLKNWLIWQVTIVLSLKQSRRMTLLKHALNNTACSCQQGGLSTASSCQTVNTFCLCFCGCQECSSCASCTCCIYVKWTVMYAQSEYSSWLDSNHKSWSAMQTMAVIEACNLKIAVSTSNHGLVQYRVAADTIRMLCFLCQF